MRVAVLSDMHGNSLALEAVLIDVKQQGVDEMVCLGDAIQGGPQPKQTVDRLRSLGRPIVMGNADAWMLTGVETGDEDIPEERLKKMETIRHWSISELTDDDLTYISDFRPTVSIPLGGNLELLCFHGSPASFDDVILPHAPKEVFDKFLGSYSDKILTGGHTHAQQIRRNGDLFFFNPGSVGMAYSHYQPDGKFKVDHWSDYAILTVEKGQPSLEFRRVPFDVNELIRTYRESGRPFAEDAIEQYQS